MSQKLAAQYPKVAAVLGKAGSVLKYGWSKKWWLAMAAIIGYAYTNTNTDPNNPNNPTDPNNPNTPTIDQKPAIDPATLAEIQKYSLNIKNWMDQLNAMYPADKETKDLQAEVAEVMKGLPQQTKPTIDQKADNKQSPADNSISKWRNMTGNIT
jgi:hypothetical protein